jgi:hypothetical protein
MTTNQLARRLVELGICSRLILDHRVSTPTDQPTRNATAEQKETP